MTLVTGNKQPLKDLFEKPFVNRTIVVLLVVIITISSFWYFLGGRCRISWDDWRYTNIYDRPPIIITLDGEKIAVSDIDNVGGYVEGKLGYNHKDLVLYPGKHTIKLSFENGTSIEEYEFFFDINVNIYFLIEYSYNISFDKSHFDLNKYNDSFFIGLNNIQLLSYIVSVVILCLLTLKYWKISVQKEKHENNGLEKEKGNNNEPHSKNKGG